MPPQRTVGTWVSVGPSSVSFGVEPPNGPQALGLAVAPCNPGTIFLAILSFDSSSTSPDGFYRTTDYGVRWTRIGAITGNIPAGGPTMLESPIRVRVDPADPTHLYVGCGVAGRTIGFWISHDSGNTFSKSAGWRSLPSSGNNMSDVYDVAVDPSDFNHVLLTFHSPWAWTNDPTMQLAVNNSGVLETLNGGTTWLVHDAQPGWGSGHGIWFITSTRWLLGTQSDGYWLTQNSGQSWTQVSTINMAHGGGQLYRSVATGSPVLYVSSSQGILRSTDDGMTWSLIASTSSVFSNSVFGDGTTLYTHFAFGSGTVSSFLTSPETDGINWSMAPGGSFSDGPFEMAYDAYNGIVYSANWGNGLLALPLR
jgi:hypothetical protein